MTGSELSSGLSDAEEAAIRDICERQILKFARLNDAGEHQALAAMFTETGTFARPTDPDNFVQGRDTIFVFFRDRPARRTRHIMTNILVEVESAERAHAHSLVTLFVGPEKSETLQCDAVLVGDFHDRLEKVGDRWLFAERRGNLTFKSELSHGG
ncbi:hypothetical protein R69746_07029 [Paraburkholderia aspalathi]|uniref:nuclear transport factor 2 family protein n=1 Tax=Paraburkholderia aspalathi TaxID=1324617 RepID=UPI00190A84B7|nr:nuclear transport factor 2 family protein [Paraburkholderia aspalathi]MBK3843032.1 nuclear transport factor 2 family protein [Paraburkholderia aspalathi]CAE6843452.1 hypothetical protein R69746_07029 [Paraburkholderia aspalathi]